VTEGAPPEEDPEDEAHARRLYWRALAWGVLTLVFLWWWKHHWQV
jgi:hypothetical protein